MNYVKFSIIACAVRLVKTSGKLAEREMASMKLFGVHMHFSQTA